MPAKVDWVWHDWMRKAFDSCPELRDLAGKPVSCLEVGVFQAGGAVWLLEEVLTHPDARYVGVDPFALPFEHRSREDIRAAAFANLRPWIDQRKAVLGDMPFHTFAVAAGQSYPLFDLVMLDGSHHAFHVLRDAVAAWPLLKVGGVMVWDDYHMKDPKYASPATRLGVDGFVDTLPVRSYQVLTSCKSYTIKKTHAAVTDFDHEDGAGI